MTSIGTTFIILFVSRARPSTIIGPLGLTMKVIQKQTLVVLNPLVKCARTFHIIVCVKI